jgi:hypothetical protein
MDELRKWQKRFRGIQTIINRAIVENQEEILDLNTAQLEEGIDSEGNTLDEYAYDSYAKFKKSMGSKAPLGIPDLKLEGDFYAGFTLKKDDKDFLIISTDSKSHRLRDKYGENIFGLTSKSIGKVNQSILEDTLKLVRQ